MSENIEQPLPSTFEEFNEQRKAAFIRVKDYKQAGNRLVGFLCSYTPLEIIDAAGAASVALCGTSDEVMHVICRILREKHKTLIMVTHDPHMAEYADRVVDLLDGRIVDIRRQTPLDAGQDGRADGMQIKEQKETEA